MKDALLPISRAFVLAASCVALTQCAMPTRDAWRIVQHQGLVPYLMGDYNYTPAGAPAPTLGGSRYLANSPGAPLQHADQPFPRIPYRPEAAAENRYLTGSFYQPQNSASSVKPRVSQSAPERRSLAETSVPTLEEPIASTPPAPKAKDNIADAPPKSNGAAKSNGAPKTNIDSLTKAPAKLPIEDLPFGSPVSGRPGMVYSPYATKDQLVDVTGMAAGETVKCPYTGKLFRVPPTQQAASTPKSAPTPEPPVETSPKSAPEAPAPTSTPAPSSGTPEKAPEAPKGAASSDKPKSA